MDYRPLGKTSIKVSSLCLGTMTWGQQNTEQEAFEQMDYAVGEGINFMDAAELYPIPPRADTQGRTEEIIGKWLKLRGKRSEVIVASKVRGRGDWAGHIRGSEARLNREHIEQAVDASLKRLGIETIDLYQTHWPDRNANFFGKLGYTPEQESPLSTPIAETLEALSRLVEKGKIRHIGVSNETPWGVMQYLNAAHRNDFPRPVSIQNPYSLLNRSYEVGLAEFTHREQIGLLAYSPLAFGTLSGKYLNGNKPEGARLTLFPDYQRYNNEEGQAAIQAYCDLAAAHGLDPAQMAITYLLTRPFMASVIIGATTMAQLRSNIASARLELSSAVIEGIEAIHRRYPNPCP